MKKRVIAAVLIFSILLVPAMAYAAPEVVIDETILEPKDPILATVIAIGPGLFVHGFGHYFCEDYKMGLLLTGVELMSIGVMTFGIIQNTNPEMFLVYGASEDKNRATGAVVFGIGLMGFLGTWLADIIMAGDAAKQYNIEHGLEFRMQQESMGLGAQYALTYNFKF